jgi:hypothetical protein
MDNRYKGLIWTNHALERLTQRGISQGDAWATWNRPQQSRPGTDSLQGSWIYYRTWGNTRIEVVAKQNEKKEWVIISVWSDPVFPGQKPSASKTSLWGNLVKILFK